MDMARACQGEGEGKWIAVVLPPWLQRSVGSVHQQRLCCSNTLVRGRTEVAKVVFEMTDVTEMTGLRRKQPKRP